MKTILSRTLIVALILGTGVLGYPPQERLMPDGAPVPEDAVVHEDSVASASETGEDYAEGDDSDMYMEPDGEETMADHRETRTERIELEATTFEPEDTRNETSSETSSEETKDQETKNTHLSPEAQNPEDADRSLETDSQNFFPSFAELFTNQRLPFTDHQQRYRPNRFLGYFQRDRGLYQAAAAASSKEVQHPLLGSGNFGVIRGGTYYPEERENEEYNADDAPYNSYYHGSPSRARANYYRNPKPQPVRGGDFFANFRDFADITAPPKSSFSHLSVVYANKNGSTTGRITEPRNIIETLRMLEEEERSNGSETSTTEVPRKKLSKSKRKLIKIKQYDEDKARRSRVSVEPLLALS